MGNVSLNQSQADHSPTNDNQPGKEQLVGLYALEGSVIPGVIRNCEVQTITRFERVWKEYGEGHAGKGADGKRRSAQFAFPGRDPLLV